MGDDVALEMRNDSGLTPMTTTRPKPSASSSRSSRRWHLSPDPYLAEPKRVTTVDRLAGYNHNGHKVTKNIHPDGESGRKWIHPEHFLRIVWRSSCTASKWMNLLWPFVPAGIALHFAAPDQHLWIFILCYIGMVPAANLVGFGGQELARKLHYKVAGVVLEVTLGSVAEIVLLITILVTHGESGVTIVRAAILGSMLANLLLCLGLCFVVGGFKRHEQTFHDAVSDIGSNLMLVAGMGLVIPTAFASSLEDRLQKDDLTHHVNQISRASAFLLLSAYLWYIGFQVRSHHGLYKDILEKDEERDQDRDRDLTKAKLTFFESIFALVLAIAFVSLMAVFLVQEIPYIVERHVSDAFMGLILVPLVEKFAEHLTAIDEAHDDQMNFALLHVLGASIQTALLNTPIILFVGWGLDVSMNLNFEAFDAIVLILAILVVGGFLRDGKSNHLEGVLCVCVYILIAIAAYYYPNPEEAGGNSSNE